MERSKYYEQPYNYHRFRPHTDFRFDRFRDYLDSDKYPILQSRLYNNRGYNSCYTCTYPPVNVESRIPVKESNKENFIYGRSFYR